jgi:glyoxylase I family protein
MIMRQPHPINIRSIDHVVIRVTNLEAMVDFYCDVLGCRLEKGPGKVKLAQLRAGDSLIDLVDADSTLGRKSGGVPDHEVPNMDHICLQVQPWDVDAIRDHLTRQGVQVGEAVARYGTLGFGSSLYVRVPKAIPSSSRA